MRIITNTNQILDANVLIETIENEVGINFESRGGAKNGTNLRNLDYSLGVETILERLKSLNIEFINIYINSKDSYEIWGNLNQRQLSINNVFDIPLRRYETQELRKLIGAELSNKKIDPNSKGGSYTKKFFLTVPNSNINWERIIRPNNESLIDDNTIRDDSFDPEDIQDAHEKILVSINKRKGQNKFRKKLLKLYNNKCAITQSNVVQVLQAAHIIPYMGEYTNHISNGIILRSDIHDLFDLNLISIDETYKVIVSPLLKDTEYEKYHNTLISLPIEKESYPSTDALKSRPKTYRE